ncbi:MAG TPA: glycosyltransferase [Vicinamibacteria bacterium]|jgi:glycosyltransferase involved in cell wall biosynthesis|nr:glycosyltransferase [Vicinamibacteria bacterium]
MVVDVSVVTPTFRRPRQLAEALSSALAQRLVTVESIVVDDSPERSAQDVVARIADPRVTFVPMKKPSGGNPALVRNAGWPLARGRFVHFLDDDDHVAEGAYAALTAELEAHPEAGVAFGRIEPFGDDPEDLRHNQRVFAESRRRARLCAGLGSWRLLLASMLFCNPVLNCSACMIRRDHIAQIGGFDPDCTPFEDREFYVRAIRRFGWRYIDRTVVHYRTGAPSLMTTLRATEAAEVFRTIYRKYEAQNGRLELLTLKILGRALFRWI